MAHGSNNIRGMSPRQRMINLMYIVLTAMLALNVSSDVLDGFVQVDESLQRTNANVAGRNDMLYDRLVEFANINPDKGEKWRDKAAFLRRSTAALCSRIDSLKLAIAVEADGDDADPLAIKSQDNLDAASIVMLSPSDRRGRSLREDVDVYRMEVSTLVTDSMRRAGIMSALSTDPVTTPGSVAPTQWEVALFESKPVIAAVTQLTKLQSDIRYAEGEALAALLANVDAGDLRVNSVDAFVIPRSRNVMRGSVYSADIVLAAVDTTRRPIVYVGDRKIDHGRYDVIASTVGNHVLQGYIEVPHDDGSVTRHDFSSVYTVVEPTATVSASMMNVLYAGIDNPIDISVPGMSTSAVSATMINGTLVRDGNRWIARPDAVGSDVTLTVSADVDGRRMPVAEKVFKTRRLPDPAPFIAVADAKGSAQRYKGGRPIAKRMLVDAVGIDAAIDDGVLDVAFKVLGFETVIFDAMGNAMPERSDGARFSQRQRDSFKRMSRGKRFFISRIKAVGPDGVERDLPPMEVIVN